jgi:hypothetical protein
MGKRLKGTVDKSIEALRYMLDKLLSKPKKNLGVLTDEDVPETLGVYLIYEDKSDSPIYVGRAKKIEPKSSGKPSGLRFRIMRNHLGKEGNDNFLKYLAEELGTDKKQAVTYLKKYCSCAWLELDNERETLLLEDFAIAVFNPRFNRS